MLVKWRSIVRKSLDAVLRVRSTKSIEWLHCPRGQTLPLLLSYECGMAGWARQTCPRLGVGHPPHSSVYTLAPCNMGLTVLRGVMSSVIVHVLQCWPPKAHLGGVHGSQSQSLAVLTAVPQPLPWKQYKTWSNGQLEKLFIWFKFFV